MGRLPYRHEILWPNIQSDPDTDDTAVQYREIRPGYRVGSDGSVWSCVNVSPRKGDAKFGTVWRNLKPHIMPTGHHYIRLGKGRKRVHWFIHRLVLEVFVGPCPPGMVCRHLDGNPTNNHISNLVWGTPQANGQDMIRHGTSNKGECSSAAVLTEDDIRAMLAMRAAGVTHCAIAKHFGVGHANVQAIFYGRSWNHITGLPLGRKPRRPKSNPGPSSVVLTEADVKEIFKAAQSGIRLNVLAKQYKVGRATIGRIVHGWAWNKVTGLPRGGAVTSESASGAG